MTMRPGTLIASMCTIEVLGMGAFATFPTLIPQLQLDWGMSNTQAGWVSGIYFAGYVAAVALLTALTDRVDARRVYLFSMFTAAAGAVGFAALADGIASAAWWRLVQGIGLAGTYMPGLKMLSDRLPDDLQSRGTAFYTASFGIGASVSYYVSGLVGDALGWRSAFAACAVGPIIALVLAAWLTDRRPHAAQAPDTHLLDFRPVLGNRPALGFTLAYTLHNLELFAFRSWIVAFLVFSQSQQPAGTPGIGWSAATIAALINLVGLPSSVITNELSARFGRQLTIVAVMLASALVGACFGFLASSAFWLVVGVAFLYGVTITADSATITAGLVRVADPRYKGTTMAMHSVIGFVGAFVGPILFGIALDAAGGEIAPHAWGVAFAVMAVLLLGGPLAIAGLVGFRRRVV